MSSTLTQTDLETRKSIRKPDEFMAAIAGGFSKLAQHKKGMLGILLGVIVLGIATAMWSSHKGGLNAAAQGALFDAKKTLDEEMKKVAAELAPAQKPGAPGVEAALYARFDVEQKLPETLKKLETVTKNHPGSIASFEASLHLGDLYFDHGQFEKALPWYSKAVEAASGPFHKGLALYSLGYAQENSGKPADAIRSYEKALGTGELDLRGDLLLATARVHTAMNDSTKAKSTYDQIISQMPDTDYAKTARVLKNELK